MKKIFSMCLLISFTVNSHAQTNKELKIAFINTGTALPPGHLKKLLTQLQHSGFEAGYSFNWQTENDHDWYQDIKLAYFYHRFVQHAIPLYTNFGYRYKYHQLYTQASIGIGYLHSIPATATLKQKPNGGYKNSRGIGRAQAMAAINLEIGYLLKAEAKRPLKIFTTYQQLLQTPFIRAYVPILPYSSLKIGIGIPVN